MTTQKEKWLVATAMQTYGGSFLVALGDTIFKADKINTAKIKKAFPEYWEEYLKLGKKFLPKVFYKMHLKE